MPARASFNCSMVAPADCRTGSSEYVLSRQSAKKLREMARAGCLVEPNLQGYVVKLSRVDLCERREKTGQPPFLSHREEL